MQKKKAISLIVLVITIIVMVVLVGTIIISLNNNGIISKTNNAVKKYNKQEIETMANTYWGSAYLEGYRSASDIKEYIEDAFEEANIDISKYKLTVTTNGVSVSSVETAHVFSDVGELIYDIYYDTYGEAMDDELHEQYLDEFYYEVDLPNKKISDYFMDGITVLNSNLTSEYVNFTNTVIDGYNVIGIEIPAMNASFNYMVAEINILHDINLYEANRYWSYDEVVEIVGENGREYGICNLRGYHFLNNMTTYEPVNPEGFIHFDYFEPSHNQGKIYFNEDNSGKMVINMFGEGNFSLWVEEMWEEYDNGGEIPNSTGTDEERIIEFTPAAIKNSNDSFEAGKTYLVIEYSKLLENATYRVVDYEPIICGTENGRHFHQDKWYTGYCENTDKTYENGVEVN